VGGGGVGGEGGGGGATHEVEKEEQKERLKGRFEILQTVMTSERMGKASVIKGVIHAV